ncbi:MAG: hypothetical protein IPJ24_04390 [bacterium]|nr:hypothetical protein [bacterium]
MMKNWTIGKRIFAGFGAVLAIMAMLGTFTTVRLMAVRHDRATSPPTCPCCGTWRRSRPERATT